MLMSTEAGNERMIATDSCDIDVGSGIRLSAKNRRGSMRIALYPGPKVAMANGS
jgi:hypothetical protein